jgi:2-C-methyl-D-erythritol 4-phosphate cytidylyltransferase
MGFDKLWEQLGDRPVLSHPLSILATSTSIDHVVLVVARDRLSDARHLVERLGIRAEICPGGAERRHSVEAGLDRLTDCAWMVVHDGARPFLTEQMIADGLWAAQETGAAVAAVAAKDTIKRVEASVVLETLRRDELWVVQTPQVFRADLLRAALASSSEIVTDEAMLLERMGVRVRIFPGCETNWKITTPPDLELARAWLSHGAVARASATYGALAPPVGC